MAVTNRTADGREASIEALKEKFSGTAVLPVGNTGEYTVRGSNRDPVNADEERRRC